LPEALRLVDALAQAGIAAEVENPQVGGTFGGGGVFAFPLPSYSVCTIREEDLARAQVIVQEVRQAAEGASPAPGSEPPVPWTCPACGESVEAQFSACWNCGTEKGSGEKPPQSPAQEVNGASREASVAAATSSGEAAAAARSAGLELWLETLVVVLIAALGPYFAATAGFIWPEVDAALGRVEVVYVELSHIVSVLPSIALVLFLIWRGGEGWRVHGLARPRLLRDGILTVIVFAVDFVLYLALVEVMTNLLGEAAVNEFYERLLQLFPKPQDLADYILSAVAIVLGAFSEELVFRGYLIPRLERLLGSIDRAALVSTLIFAGYHVYQGVIGLVGVFLFGLVMAVFFCLTKRLWPLVVVHAAVNTLTI
jgi:membrane protease YdiL (CAAX protease family)